jgi:hypothetical protein
VVEEELILALASTVGLEAAVVAEGLCFGLMAILNRQVGLVVRVVWASLAGGGTA